MKFRIVHQGLLLISIPLTCELVIFGVLVGLEVSAEKAAKKAAHARAVSDGVTKLERDIHAIGFFLRGLQYKQALTADINPYCQNLYRDVDDLRLLTASKPEFLPMLQRTEQAARQGQFDLEMARKAVISEPWNAYSIVKQARKSIDTTLGEIMSPQLVTIAESFSDARAERTAQNDRAKARALLIAAVPFSLLLAVAASFVFTRRIADRLSKLCEDAELLAKGRALAPLMSGSDEIARLDKIYHESSQMLIDTTRKLQAAYDLAADLILSIDEGGRVLSANMTCLDVLCLSSEQLIASRVTEIIEPQDRENFLRQIELAEEDERNQLNFETTLKTSQGKLVSAVCAPRYSRLEKATFCVFHDITQRKEAERMRSEVFAMITHDLRGPVSSFGAFLEFTEMGKMGELSESATRLLPMAERSVSKMRQLLDDILTLEQVRSGVVKPNIESVAVDELFKAVCDTLYFEAEKRSVKIAAEPTDSTVQTDRNRLERVVLNFLSNALKFSPPGSTISLYSEIRGDEVSINVKDQGPGMAAGEIENIFRRFYHGTKDDSDLPSTGLGLAICQELAALLGAHVKVQSELGRGTIFSITFSC